MIKAERVSTLKGPLQYFQPNYIWEEDNKSDLLFLSMYHLYIIASDQAPVGASDINLLTITENDRISTTKTLYCNYS